MERLSPTAAPASSLAPLESPLLESIGRELDERGRRVQEIEALLAARRDRSGQGSLMAELATHRGELSRCHRELERLGCSLLRTRPLTIRIRPRRGRRGLVWRPGRG